MKKFLKSKVMIMAMMVILICSMRSMVSANQPLANGTYSIEVTSSAAMFKVIDAKLNIVDGTMTSIVTLSGTGYPKLYMGTEVEAVTATEDTMINFVADENGKYTFNLPVSALDTEIPVAAYSPKNDLWYARTLTFNSATITGVEAQPIEEVVVEEVKEEVKEVVVEEVKEEVAMVEVKEEAIPKTSDKNMVFVASIVLVLCGFMIIKNKKTTKEA